MVWACQGIILGNNSTDKDRGTKSGMFMAIYMFGSVIDFLSLVLMKQALGNFASGYIVRLLHVSTDIHNGWNGSTSILFLFLAISAVLAVIPYAFIRHVDPPKETPLNSEEMKEVVETTEGEMKVKEEEPKPQEKHSIWKEMKDVFKCAFSKKMAWLICFFFFDGYQQVFVTSHFTRQIVDVGSIGTIMGIYSIVDVIFSYIHGWLSDHFGHVVVVTLATVCEIAGIIISWYANAYQNWLNYLTGIVFAISDAGYQTEVFSRSHIDFQCLSTVNSYFALDRTNANSTFRMVWSLMK